MHDIPRLILFPATPAGSLSASVLTGLLQEIGLVGACFDAGSPARFLAGEAFLNHIVFLGCSPAIELAADAGGRIDVSRVTHVVVRECPDVIVQTGDNTRLPGCPHCSEPLHGLTEWLAQSWVYPALWPCRNCDSEVDPLTLGWRRTLAFGRLFVEIWQVYPHEAVPGNILLERLTALGAGPWRHAWLRGPAPVPGQ